MTGTALATTTGTASDTVLRGWLDTPIGWTLSQLGGVAISSFPAYVAMLHSPFLSSGSRGWIAGVRARAAFHNARRRVPAYKKFLEAKGVPSPRRFADIPVMTKDAYIKKYSLEDTLQGGKMPLRGAVIDESSGSTGMPSNWVRGDVERAATRKLIQFAARATLGREPFVLINAFALGPWATGMNVSMAMVDACVVKSVGPDVSKIVNTLELLGPKYKYVLSGYPPFMKVLVDTAKIDWEKYSITAIVGGEGMSEPLRAHLGRAFDKVISSFGASDLEINLALESDWSTALRKAMLDRPELVEKLTGRRDVLPMAFQYDPTQVYMENGPDDHVLFTLCRLENVSPRIRYDLADRGRLRPWAEVAGICESLGVKGLPRADLRLPVLLHWGREEHAVAFYGCKITPDHVQSAIMNVPTLAGAVAEYALRVYEDEKADKRLEVILELKADAPAPPDTTRQELFDRLAEGNQDFRESRRMIPEHLAPMLTIEPPGKSRLAGQDARLKKRYVLT
jgi:phenylacetate-CoA ligase